MLSPLPSNGTSVSLGAPGNIFHVICLHLSSYILKTKNLTQNVTEVCFIFLVGPTGLLLRQIESIRRMLSLNEPTSVGQVTGAGEPQWKVLVYDQVGSSRFIESSLNSKMCI